MKKKLMFALFVVFIVSCDEIGGSDNYTVVNNCNEAIVTSVVLVNDSILNFNVTANSEYLFRRSGAGIPAKSSDDLVEHVFKRITVTKDGKISQKNYVVKEAWQYVDSADTHRKWYLHVNPEDFE